MPDQTTRETCGSLPALLAGTMVATDLGDVPVDWLRPGDAVITADHGPQPLAWIGRANSRSVPLAVSLPPGSLGADLPAQLLRISAATGILMSGSQLDLHFAESEMLARAGEIADHRGTVPVGPAYHLVLDAHDLILAEGLWVETVLLDAETAGVLASTPDARTLGPAAIGSAGHHRSVRPRLAGWEGAMFRNVPSLVVGRRAAA